MNGLIGKKIGMTQVFLGDGSLVPVSVVEAGPCTVTQVKTVESDGYKSVQLGFGSARHTNKAEQGHLKGKGPFAILREFRMGEKDAAEVGQQVDIGIFAEGESVDVVGQSRGLGFAGGVKRYHFRGGPKTHGQSNRHRAPGSVGSTTTPGRVFRGLRMAGHMGDDRVTTHNVKVVGVDKERNLLLIRGAVPGNKGGFVLIQKAKKAKKSKQTFQPKSAKKAANK